jgi:hypothetical protein
MGGVCSDCLNHDKEEGVCTLRNQEIEEPSQTTCHQHNNNDTYPKGPLYAVIGAKVSIVPVLPYYKGSRPRNTAIENEKDSFIYIKLANGNRIDFDDQKEYIEFCEENMELEIKRAPSISKNNKSQTESFIDWLGGVTGLG